MYSTLSDHQVRNDPFGAPAYLEMRIGEWEITGFEIENQQVRDRPGPEVAGLPFPAEYSGGDRRRL